LRIKRVGAPPNPVTKVELLQKKDVTEYERTKNELVKVLQKAEGYEPAVDDIHVDEIARTAIYLKQIEVFLDSNQADEDTYYRVTDTKLKLSKIIENALHQLALNRRDRIGKQTEANLTKELHDAMVKVMKAAEQ